MRPPQPLPLPIRDRPFTVSEALALGLTRQALRRDDLRAPHHGIRVPSHLPDTLITRARAALLALPPGAVLGAPTAVELCGLPQPLHAPPVLSRMITAIVPPGSRDAVRYRWASSAQMQAAVDGRAGCRGVVRARQVLALVRYRVESPMETRARLLFTSGGLPEPACGRDTTEDDEWLARLDLSWPLVRVGVEIDGDHHRTDRRQWLKDVQGRRNLEAARWRILVFTADDILRRPDEMVRITEETLRARGLVW